MHARRFWNKVSITEDRGHLLLLDDRPLKTPSDAAFRLPCAALAKAVAEEWRGVDKIIEPEAMPMTRLASFAIDLKPDERESFARGLADYIHSDLIAYRAEGPEELVKRQSAWDEWVNWARAQGFALEVTMGLMPQAKNRADHKLAREALAILDNFAFGAARELITLTGSFILGLAMLRGELDAHAGFELAFIDELHQAEQWGEDEEATIFRANRHAAIERAMHFLRLSRLQ